MTKARWRVHLRRVLLVALVVVAAEQTYRHSHEYIFAEKFATVEPGKIYRGAWQRDWPMRRIIREDKIKTIVALAHTSDAPLAVQEKALADELGVKWVHVPIVDARTVGDPTVSERLLEAAAAIADPENQPVYFHCHHGINRASMAQMAYRMLYCGWDLKQAEEEIAQTFGLKEVDKGPDYRHMTAFYKNFVLPRREAGATAGAAPVIEANQAMDGIAPPLANVNHAMPPRTLRGETEAGQASGEIPPAPPRIARPPVAPVR